MPCPTWLRPPPRGRYQLIGEPRVWDKGFGTEATALTVSYGFEVVNLESIQLGVNADNSRAVRAYEKVGFVHEGCRRKFIYRNRRYDDLVVMSIIREEYESRVPQEPPAG